MLFGFRVIFSDPFASRYVSNSWRMFKVEVECQV